MAYFAKGPLSRARAAFHLDCDAALDMNDLVDFLKRLVLTTVQIDKKFRESIPEIISQTKATANKPDDAPKVKKRKSKKMTVDKRGLYPVEDEYIRTWWGNNEPDTLAEHHTEAMQRMRSAVSKLRTRETYLQMILIMEILALEPLIGNEDGESQLPKLPGQVGPDVAEQPKKRNKHKLPVLLDVHVDRLCIWQSTNLEFEAQASSSNSAEVQANGSTHKNASEPLRDFCTDVIVPL